MTEEPSRLESARTPIDEHATIAMAAGYATLLALQVAVNIYVFNVTFTDMWALRYEWFYATFPPWVAAAIVFDELLTGPRQ